MSDQIKALIFDLGNVLININVERFFISLMEYSNRKFSQIKKGFIETYQYIEIGKYSEEEFYQEMKKVVGFQNITKVQFIDMFNGILDEWNDEMLEFVKKLRKTGEYQLYALSNTNPIHIKFLKNNSIDIRPFFNDVFFSYEIGLAKPNPEVYAFVLKAINCKPEECLFVDDNLNNINNAAKLGFNVLVFKDSESFLTEIEDKIGTKLFKIDLHKIKNRKN